MKRITTIMMMMLLGTASLWARPATKGAVSVKQPDGTTVTIRLIGDEYMHYNTTDDGYSLVRNDKGFYVYAQKVDGQLKPTDIIAHDEKLRTATELAFLATTTKHLAPEMSQTSEQVRHSDRLSRVQALHAMRADRYDYSKFKGLVILVEYNDCKFQNTNYKDIMEGMINQENYTGTDKTNIYRNVGSNWRHIANDIICTGSMRDYFRDNSNGVFNPTFDIVGPVSVNRSQFYPNGGNSAYDNNVRTIQLLTDVFTAADSQVNFADYDVNKDGKVDMVYIIYAGLSAHVSGNSQSRLWPHQSDLSFRQIRKDGVILGRYACSTELFGFDGSDGTASWSVLEGIGTMCHEFSHVLGLPDFYDTDYSEGGGQSADPGGWSVMANGADYDTGRRPCAYSLYERYALGFATPQVIDQPGDFSLDHVATSNTGYRLNTSVNKEYFMLENRQNIKWDKGLAGHGMLIFRVDSTNNYVWESNTINNNPNHNYYELIRAGGVNKQQATDGNYYVFDTNADPFPGSKNVTEITNTTSPSNLLTWSGKTTPFGLRNIKESNGQITFEAFDVNVLTDIILQSTAIIGVGTTLLLTTENVPETATSTFTWASDNPQVATVSNIGLVTGVGVGTAHITITADNGVSATCTVTVKDLPMKANITEFCQMEEGSEALLLFNPMTNPAKVLYVNGDDIYLRDNSGSIVFRGTGIDMKRGDWVQGMVYGKLVHNNQMPMLTSVEDMTNAQGLTIIESVEPDPIELHLSQLDEHYYANYVTVKKVRLTKDNGVWATFGDKRVRLYNTLGIKSPKITVPSDMSRRYDITAIFGTNVLNGQVIDELYLLKSPTTATYTAPTSITLSEAVRLEVGRTLTLSPVITPATADAFLLWSSSDTAVVTVNASGKLTGRSNGTATITVRDAETGLQAECVVTVGDRIVTSNISTFRSLPVGSEADLILTDAQVLFVHGAMMYVRDASGAIILSNTALQAKRNQILNGRIFGKRTDDHLMPMLSYIEGATTTDNIAITEGSEPAPRRLKTENLSSRDFCDLVLVEATQLESDGGLYAVGGDVRARLYNTFGLSGIRVPATTEGKYFNVTAIFGTTDLNGTVINELKLLKSPEETTAPDGIETIETKYHVDAYYDLNGRRLEGQPAHGVYIVRQNGMLVKKAK